jgi:hypothetical protein
MPPTVVRAGKDMDETPGQSLMVMGPDDVSVGKDTDVTTAASEDKDIGEDVDKTGAEKLKASITVKLGPATVLSAGREMGAGALIKIPEAVDTRVDKSTELKTAPLTNTLEAEYSAGNETCVRESPEICRSPLAYLSDGRDTTARVPSMYRFPSTRSTEGKMIFAVAPLIETPRKAVMTHAEALT